MKYLILLTILLSGCSKYPLQTNLDKDNFTEYFSISGVEYYAADTLQNYQVEQLGLVEGESCQTADNLPPAEEKQAKIAAKRKASALHANGIIIRSCIAPPASKACLSSYVCYGDAINVNPLNRSNDDS
ncbi:Rcs stress response system protein RcsF [Moritella viscosa]|uniref:Rcs stress response system protein RcsF n=1 Tax=Moritella viscosa TaxID=80854 RepID=UPI00091E0B4A|nr:Rcs stress response system protein RcsF [Moritella viscosa]SGY82800.1 Lipoprotein, putative [Moritella viscosa]